MQVNVLLFGQLREIAGTPAVVMNDMQDTRQLLSAMKAMYPALGEARFIVAVDKKIITGNTLLNENSTVALLPPFSGG